MLDYASPDAELGQKATDMDIEERFDGPDADDAPRRDDDAQEEADMDRRTVPSRIVEECKAARKLQEALGQFTQLECEKNYGDWSKGGGPRITRSYTAYYKPSPDAPLETGGARKTPSEAVEKLIARCVRPVLPVSLGTLDEMAMQAAHEDAKFTDDGAI